MPRSAATRTIMPARMSRGLSRSGRRGGAIFSSLFRVQQILELRHELPDVAEMPVHGCEPHIRDFIELLELLHDERPDLVRADLFFRALLQRTFNAISDGFERRDADRAFFAR